MKASYREVNEAERLAGIALEICIHQGYVPLNCLLNGGVVFALINKGEDPCAGCNLNRNICGGRPKKND